MIRVHILSLVFASLSIVTLPTCARKCQSGFFKSVKFYKQVFILLESGCIINISFSSVTGDDLRIHKMIHFCGIKD